MVHSSSTLPPLDTIEAFAMTAELGSFSAAADALNLTHGAVSRQVARLERWMGLRLFERAARGVFLTPEGERFRTRAIDALQLLGDATDRWRPQRGRATVRISVTPSIAALWLFPRMTEIERDDIDLDVLIEHRLADFGEDNDLAVRCGQGPWAGVRSVALWPERLVPIAGPALARELGEDAGPRELLEHDLLHDSNVLGWRAWLAPHGIGYIPRPRDRRFEDYTVVLEACANGLGIALARLPVAGPYMDAGRVVPVSRTLFDSPIGFHLVRPQDAMKSRAAIATRRILELAGHGPDQIEDFLA